MLADHDKTRGSLKILIVAVALGVLGDALLRAIPWGLNIFLWMAGLLVALEGWRPKALERSGLWLTPVLLLSSGAFIWRASPALNMLNVIASLVALSFLIMRAQGGRVLLAGLLDYALGSLVAAFNAAFGSLRLLLDDIDWKQLFGDKESRTSMAVGRGLLFAFPLLLIFGGLFVSADAVFKGLVESALHLNFYRLFSHFFVTAFCAWIVAGYFRGVLLGNDLAIATGAVARPQIFTIGIIETVIALGLLDVLFLCFVIVQFRYFFGGAPWVHASIGLSYAEYARQGFFELVTVAGLVLPLLLLSHWLLRKDSPRNERIYRALAGAQMALLYVIMASAVERMRLYQQEYGLTELRLYAMAFMGWLAVVFIWFAATVLIGRRERFAFGATVAGFLLIAVLHVLNPDALIVRANAARAATGHPFDARYAGSLSADAVPALVAALPVLSPPDRCTLAARALKRWSPPGSTDWRVWNWSRAHAWRVIKESSASLQETACSEKKE